MIPIDEQVAAARRELAMRRNVYPKWVDSRRMTQDKADREIAAMEAIIETLELVKAVASHGPLTGKEIRT